MRKPCLTLVFASTVVTGCASTDQSGSIAAAPPPWRALAGARLQDVSSAEYRVIPGRPDCTSYTFTGMLDGKPRTVSGTACHGPDGTVQVREGQPGGPDIVATITPAALEPQQDFGRPYASDYSYAGDYFSNDEWGFGAPFGVVVLGGPLVFLGHRSFGRFTAHGGFRAVHSGFHGGFGGQGRNGSNHR